MQGSDEASVAASVCSVVFCCSGVVVDDKSVEFSAVDPLNHCQNEVVCSTGFSVVTSPTLLERNPTVDPDGQIQGVVPVGLNEVDFVVG
jgi:hypothetical protein